MPSDDDRSDFPVKVDITASAKAGLELKGEIPSRSLGNLVDSLVDIIRPFSERRGLKADLLRLQREDVILEIARRASARIEYENIKPIPLKTIVPLLEKASLEDPSSDMIEWWAGLLAQTAQDTGLQHPIYSDVLAKITAAEASYLQRMLDVSDLSVLENNDVDIEGMFISEVINKISPLVGGEDNDEYRSITKSHLDQFRKILENHACVVFNLTFPAVSVKFYRDLNQEYVPFGRSYRDVTDVLRAVGVSKTTFLTMPMPAPFIGEFNASMEIFSLTTLGRKILHACRKKL